MVLLYLLVCTRIYLHIWSRINIDVDAKSLMHSQISWQMALQGVFKNKTFVLFRKEVLLLFRKRHCSCLET